MHPDRHRPCRLTPVGAVLATATARGGHFAARARVPASGQCPVSPGISFGAAALQVYGRIKQVTACGARLTTQEGVNGFDFGG